MRTFIICWLLCSTLHAQGWDVVKAVPPGTLLRVNSSITGRVDSVDDTQITLNGRRFRQDVIRRVERVERRRKRNAGLAFLGGFAFGALGAKFNGSNALGMAWAGSVFGGFFGLAAATGSRPAQVVIYQR